jgi:hypothetical protein
LEVIWVHLLSRAAGGATARGPTIPFDQDVVQIAGFPGGQLAHVEIVGDLAIGPRDGRPEIADDQLLDDPSKTAHAASRPSITVREVLAQRDGEERLAAVTQRDQQARRALPARAASVQ